MIIVVHCFERASVLVFCLFFAVSSNAVSLLNNQVEAVELLSL